MYSVQSPGKPSGLRLAVVIINWERAELTIRALGSLVEGDDQPDIAVVVDNGSRDDSLQRLRAWASCPDAGRTLQVAIVSNSNNAGFAAAANIGAQEAMDDGADALLFLNNDATVEHNTISAIRKSLLGMDWGVAACSSSAATPFHGLEPRRIRSIWPGTMPAHPLRHTEPSRIRRHARPDFASGAGMVVHAGVWNDLRGFDEDFFFGVEDLDFCQRARDAGVPVTYLDGARVRHDGASSISKPDRRYLIAHKANVLFLKKHAARRWFLPLYLASASVLAIARCLRQFNSQRLRYSLRGLAAGLVATRTTHRDLHG